MARPLRADEFACYDFSKTEPGDRVIYSLASDVDPQPGRTGERHVFSLACIAARGKNLYLFGGTSGRGDDRDPQLVEVCRDTGHARRAWRVFAGHLLSPLSLEPPLEARRNLAPFVPKLTVLRAREREFRSVAPAIRGWEFHVRSEMSLTPFAGNFPPGFLEYQKSISLSGVSAFSDRLPFPHRANDPVRASHLFLPASWSERTLQPPTPVFLRIKGSGPQLAMRLRSWSRSDSGVVALGEPLMRRVDHGPHDSA